MTTTASQAPRPSGLSHREILVVFGGLILGMVLGALDGTIVTTALPTIVGELGGLEHLPWVGTIYLLTSTVAVPLYGKLSDLYGRRRLFRAAIVVFLVGSVLTGVSQNMLQLIVFRGLQGIGGGGLMAMGMAIIGEVLSPRERGRYMGYLTPAFFLASVGGPLLGGFFVDQLSWRWIFYINLPLGLAALAVTNHALRVLPFSPRRARIDVTGATLLVAAASTLLLVSTWGGRTYRWGSPTIVGMAAGGVVLAIAFVAHESRTAEPILPIRLFRLRVFSVVTSLSFLLGCSMFGALVFIPLFLQSVQGASATGSGIRMFPIMCGLMGASVVTGRLISRTGRYRIFCVVGMTCAPVCLLAMAQLGRGAPTLVYSACLLLLGASMGMVMPVMILAVQNAVDFDDLGVATSAVSFFQSLGGTFGLALFGALFNARFTSEAAGRLPADGRGFDIDALASSPEQVASLSGEVAEAVTGALAASIQAVFLAAIPLMVLGLVLAVLLTEVPLKETSYIAAPVGGEAMAPGDNDRVESARADRPAPAAVGLSAAEPLEIRRP